MKRRVLFVVIVLVVLALFYIKPLLQMVFPIQFTTLIVSAAEKAGVDPILIAAVMRVESEFISDAVSTKGAVGLMQLMPDTAAWVAEQKRLSFSKQDLLRPGVNIELGAHYLAYLLEIFPTEYAALAAYNAGPTHVQQWLDWGIWDGTWEALRLIPFNETRSYIRKVEIVRHLYQYIYYEELSFERS